MNPPSGDDTVVQEIAIKASAERIFEALTNPAERLKWWVAPGRFRVIHAESDLRPGGKWIMTGTQMAEKPFTVSGQYREIERPRLLVFTWLPDWQQHPTESLLRWDLEEKDGITTVRVTHSGLTPDARSSHRGWPQVLGFLQAYLERPV